MSSDRTDLVASPARDEIAAPETDAVDRGDRGASGRRQQVARGTLINGAFNVGLDTLGLIRSFAIAAFLTTSEYGILGMLVIALGTLGLLKQVGIVDKYVQQDEPDQELAFQKAFTLELLALSGLAVITVAAVPLLALVYGRSELVAPGLLVAAFIPVVAFYAPTWVFYRRLDFVRQRALLAVEPITMFIVSVGLAAGGFGYWSLVWGAIAGGCLASLASVLASPYPLALRYERGTLSQYFAFSWPLFLAMASGVLAAQVSLLVSEAELGLAGAGAIFLAASITLYTDKVDAILTQTLYPAICAVRERKDLLLESFTKSNRITLMWGMPFGVGLALFAPDLVRFGLGEKWEVATGLIQAFGLIAAFNHIGFNWTAYYRARGETRPIAVWGSVTFMVLLLTAIPLLITHGLDGYALGMGITAAVSLALRTYYLGQLFPRFEIIAHSLRAMAPTVPAVLATLGLRALTSGRSPELALAELGLYVAVTAVATLVLERTLLREAIGYLRRRALQPAAG